MKESARILVVEDEPGISGFISAALQASGYDVERATNGKEALMMIASRCPDAVVLDLGLPDIDGQKIIASVREWSSVPILVVSARAHERDKIAAFDHGADDYIIKPFSPRVLMARIRANLRNTDRSGTGSTGILKIGQDVEIDNDKLTVTKKGKHIPLTKNEFMIFSKMASRPEKTWTRDELIIHALGYEYEGFERSIDSYIKNIRKKLADPEHDNGYIKTVHGFGYRISE